MAEITWVWRHFETSKGIDHRWIRYSKNLKDLMMCLDSQKNLLNLVYFVCTYSDLETLEGTEKNNNFSLQSLSYQMTLIKSCQQLWVPCRPRETYIRGSGIIPECKEPLKCPTFQMHETCCSNDVWNVSVLPLSSLLYVNSIDNRNVEFRIKNTEKVPGESHACKTFWKEKKYDRKQTHKGLWLLS